MSKNKNGGLDQYGAKPFEQQQFGTAGIEGVNGRSHFHRVEQKTVHQQTSGYLTLLAAIAIG